MSANIFVMDKTFFTQKVLPHIVAVLLFFVVTIVFFHPIVFEGEVIRQHDINQGVGSAQEIVEFREKTGEEALWTNSMFSGMPAYLVNIYWSGEKILKITQNVLSLFLDQPLRETFLAFISFYVLLLVFGIRPYLAIAGALAYGLNTFFMVSVEAGHIWKVRAIAYMPLALAGIHLAFRGRLWLGAILTALAMALEFYANHLQVTYYLFLTVLIYGVVQLYYFIKEKKAGLFFKIVATLVVAVIIAIGSNFGRLWSTYEYGKHSIRGKSELTSEKTDASSGLDREYAFAWSSGKWESLTLLVPHLYGGASGQYQGKDSQLAEVLRQNNVPPQQINQYEKGLLGYWGDQPGTAGPVYAGAILCFLFVLGIFFTEKKHRVWLVAATVFSIMLSWGKNFDTFNYLMFDYFPGYNKFRSVTMTIVIALMCINLLGFTGLENLLKKGVDENSKKRLFWAGGIVVGLLVLIAIFASPAAPEGAGIPNAIKDAVEQDRLGIIRSDVMRSLFFVAVAFALVYFYLKKKIGKPLFAGLFILFMTLDLALVDGRYINSDNFTKPSGRDFLEPTAADQKILRDDTKFRVLNLSNPFIEARTSAFHSSIGGYHGAKMRRYQDLIERHLQEEIQAILADRAINRSNTKVLSALNTKYFVAGPTENAVIQNPYVLGNAWFVEDVLAVSSPDEEIAALDEVGLDSVAVVDKSKFDVEAGNYSASGTIELTEYQPNKLTYHTSNSGVGLAVFSEIYYPEGWTATIDGGAADIIRVDYVLRGLEVPPGEHEIVFTFKPDAYYIGNKVSLVSNIILLGLMLSGVFVMYKNKKQEKV